MCVVHKQQKFLPTCLYSKFTIVFFPKKIFDTCTEKKTRLLTNPSAKEDEDDGRPARQSPTILHKKATL